MSKQQILLKVLSLLQNFKPTTRSGYIKAAILSFIGLRLLQQFLRQQGLWFKKSVAGQHIVITGAGSGIGR